MTHTHLIIGGISSGKSAFALRLANTVRMPKIYVATADNRENDPEMQAKITAHQQQREAEGANWQTLESPIAIVDSLQQTPTPSVCVIDCMTMWLTNIMWQHKTAQIDQDIWVYIQSYLSPLIRYINTTPHTLIFVTSEVGYAPVHDHPLARGFQRYQGQVNQAIATAVNSVYLMTAGIATQIK